MRAGFRSFLQQHFYQILKCKDNFFTSRSYQYEVTHVRFHNTYTDEKASTFLRKGQQQDNVQEQSKKNHADVKKFMLSLGLSNYKKLSHFNDQVYSTIRVPTQVNTNHHESDTSQHESNTRQHESDTSQHESARVRHESARVQNRSQIRFFSKFKSN